MLNFDLADFAKRRVSTCGSFFFHRVGRTNRRSHPPAQCRVIRPRKKPDQSTDTTTLFQSGRAEALSSVNVNPPAPDACRGTGAGGYDKWRLFFSQQYWAATPNLDRREERNPIRWFPPQTSRSERSSRSEARASTAPNAGRVPLTAGSSARAFSPRPASDTPAS